MAIHDAVEKIITFVFFVLTSASTFACEHELKKFPRDCNIQDRLQRVRETLALQNKDLDDVAEYRVLRFIGREEWQQAKESGKSPASIYKPAPQTWNVWDRGIRHLFTGKNLNGQLTRREFTFNVASISEMNKWLLFNIEGNVKDPGSNRTLAPGQIRSGHDLDVSFCDFVSYDYVTTIRRSEASLRDFQKRWERASGINFAKLAKRSGVADKGNSSFVATMTMGNLPCEEGMRSVSYEPSRETNETLKRLQLFIDVNLNLSKIGRSVLSPTEFAAVVQKWFVTAHPFADGNGRTSRALQDLILANYGMPFAPAGDLLDDASSTVEDYIKLNYEKTESMLAKLKRALTTMTRSSNANPSGLSIGSPRITV